MKTLFISRVKANLGGLVEEIKRHGGEIVITRNGRPAAVLVSPEEYKSWNETRAIRADRGLMREIRASLAALKARNVRLYTLEELLK